MGCDPLRGGGKRKLFLGLTAVILVGGCLLVVLGRLSEHSQGKSPSLVGIVSSRAASSTNPVQVARGRNLTVWWEVLPGDILRKSVPTGAESNIHPADYVGRPNACQPCHQKNYETWSVHPHRWMNALADPTTVKGDFSSGAGLSYRGGRATFIRAGDGFFMHLQRGEKKRAYRITQTIGSRFFQYYVGKQQEGPELKGHRFYTTDHVLPFGYWLAQKEWAPIVHIGPEKADEERLDPFAPPDAGINYAEYAVGCNACHTTFPLADMFTRRTGQMGEFAPWPMHWSMRGFLETAHPELLDEATGWGKYNPKGTNPMHDWDASGHAVTLGVSCEACHLGTRRHVESAGRVPPRFAPVSPYLRIESKVPPAAGARTRTSTGPAPAAMSASGLGSPRECPPGIPWNTRTPCTGAAIRDSIAWTATIRTGRSGRAGPCRPTRMTALCLKCHQTYQAADKRLQHTHHPLGSEGARCMNCHMPRINEGVEDVVRTHMIYSPTRADMIEANHPNACNLCHTDMPIDWTLRTLKDWYKATYDSERIAENYPRRDKPVGLGWLDSKNPSVRLVAAEAMIRNRASWAMPRLLDALDDPFLINRQFAYKGLQEMLDVRLADFGYRFYMMPEERQKPLAQVRARFTPVKP